MLQPSLSVRSTALVRTRYTELAQRVLHDAEEMAMSDQREDPTADEVLLALFLASSHDPLLCDLTDRLEADRVGIAEIIATRLRRGYEAPASDVLADSYRAWIRMTALAAPVDLRVMLGSLIISTWLPAVSRVVLEQEGITHETLIDDLNRHPSGDSDSFTALLGTDPTGPPLGRLIIADEALMAIGRERIVRDAAARFAAGEHTILNGKRGVGKAILARAAAAASGRLAVEVPMTVLAHLDASEFKARFADLVRYLSGRQGGLVLTGADKRADDYLAGLPVGLPVLVTADAGVRLAKLSATHAPRRITVREPGADTSWSIINAWAQREGIDQRLDPGALPAAVSLAGRFMAGPDSALPGSAIELLRQARPLRSDGIIDEAALEAAVSISTGLPSVIVSEEARTKLNALAPRLSSRIIGQLAAIGVTTKVVRRRATRLGREKSRPVAVLLFLGPTGVGKTELARAIADIAYGTDEALVKFNMSDYQERHEIAKLLGSPPGYVGSDEEGELSLRIRARENEGGVLLLDEYEKAHASVSNLMLAVYDDGVFVGNKGKPVSLANWIIIMTSNLGSDAKAAIGFGDKVAARDPLAAARARAVRDHFRPEFLNRVHAVVHFEPLSEDELDAVLGLRLASFNEDLGAFRQSFVMGPRMRRRLAAEAAASGYGARDMMLRRFPEEVEDRFADLLLSGEYVAGACYVLELDAEDEPLMRRLMPGEPGYVTPWVPVPAARKHRRLAKRQIPEPPGSLVMRA